MPLRSQDATERHSESIPVFFKTQNVTHDTDKLVSFTVHFVDGRNAGDFGEVEVFCFSGYVPSKVELGCLWSSGEGSNSLDSLCDVHTLILTDEPRGSNPGDTRLNLRSKFL
jgi:hypothetical protein